MTTYYTEEHEWIIVEGDTATLGITAHAAEQLGEAVFVEVKDEGEEFDKQDEIGVIESVKAAAEIYAPLDCEIIESNEALVGDPAKLTNEPEAEGWVYKIKITDPGQLEELMSEAEYKAFVG